jgi:tRNA threonylcarbamoyladenosine biosynthesis protein TsaE
MIDLHVAEAKPDDADALVDVIHAAFGARPPLDPPGSALHENVAGVAAAVREHGGLLATVDGDPAGVVLFAESDGWLELRRVSVHPRFQHRGVGTAMIGCAEEVAEAAGVDGLRLTARVELPMTLRFWQRRGYVEAGRTEPEVQFAKRLPVEVEVPSAEAMRDLGLRLAGLFRPGDLVLLHGELGAGKTTLTQGIGAGLNVRGDVTSPTFVISRVHRATGARPPLVHVDAYRLGGVAELDDLDLDASLDEAVTVVEWGEGLAEGLADNRLEVVLTRPTGGLGDPHVPHVPMGEEPRRVRVIPIGPRWIDAPLRAQLTS